MTHARKYIFIPPITVLLLVFLCFPVPAFTQEADSLPIPLFIDEIYSGEIGVTILSDESVQIRPSELISYLQDLMSDEAIETAVKIFPESGWLNLTEMGGLGVRILFKFEDLTMHITIPAHLQRETVVSFRGSTKEPAGEYVEQSDFSAFMNLNLWNKFTYETLSYDFSATPEIGLNIFNWVIEARGGIRTNGDLLFWDYARLVKDFKSAGYRLEVGDLTLPVTDLSGASKLLGASFRKNQVLAADTDARQLYAREIFIREPSKVEIYMNDRKIREKDYPSGNYIFQDFPLSRGINRISIRWEDSEGAHEEDIVIPYDSSLLDAGETDLGIAAGLPDRQIILPTFSSYQYLGITDRFTFGITESFDIDTLELAIHPDFLLSTGIGNFNLVPIWGMSFSGGQKIDASLSYQMLKPGQNSYLNFGGSIAYTYNSITNAELPPSLLSVEGYYNFYFGDGFSFTPEASWGWKFDESRNLIRAKVILKKSIRGGSALSANIGVDYDRELSFSATISYSSSFPDQKQNIYIIENLETQKLSAFWNRYSSDDNDFSLNASTELPMSLDEKLSLGFSGGYNHSLFSLDCGHDFDAIINTGATNNSTYLRANSGIAYAEGNFLLTKAVTDSFIIIAPGEQFMEQTLKVNPSLSESDLEIKGKPGIMSNIHSFKTCKVYIEPEELPLGMDAAGMKYLAYPSYKSAFVVTPHAEIRVFAGGFIKDSDGFPVDTVLGSLTGKNTSERVDFFTDDNGYFEAYNLLNDIYILKLNGTDQSVEIDLSAAEGGFFDAETITLPEG